ncbi:BglII/BstYI family type II restriction endonuclease [uncultured Parvibaculum sp.]|uniref:BglII/BstYI family type II restriction endonuclease n=1 Tax=uncultured Parvibaculum sp. TaxID=291828 RepID=UPI0030DBCE91|tara:strand:- start:55643 stop:56437 length:795 start_codon:yes stop_codon:yes gene_type:complete
MADDAEEDLNGGEDEAPVDVAAAPNNAADPQPFVDGLIPVDIRERFEVYSYRNAAAILTHAHQEEFHEILAMLRELSIPARMIRKPGGNESEIPKLISSALRPRGWRETTIQADLAVQLISRVPTAGGKAKATERRVERFTRERFLDGHKVDYVKGRVAFDLEWNSKDQTFDRDLYAFSAFSQCGVIDAAVILTRSASLNPLFRAMGQALKKDGTEDPKRTISQKYGASTTWMGKLLYRLNAGRNGGCPVLAVGIGPECIELEE